ncbi:MAG: four-carbon acid sugar kinase family protein [Bacillota bacterium]
MIRVVVVADDITGGNAAGVLLTREGLRTATVLLEKTGDLGAKLDFDALVVSSNSRRLAPQEAYARVRACLSPFAGMETLQFSKRIDTTLRGNVATEINAALDELADVKMAVVVPAFPRSGRVTVGGYQMVGSVPLERTLAAADPRAPILKSHVPSLIQDGTHRRVAHIPLADVLQGFNVIIDRLIEVHERGSEIVVIDAVADEDIATIARAVVCLPFRVLHVDPGPFTALIAGMHGFFHSRAIQSEAEARVVLALVGSVTPSTHNQIRRLKAAMKHMSIPVDARLLASGGEWAIGTINRVATSVLDRMSTQVSRDAVVIIESSSSGQSAIDLAALDREMGFADGMSAANICAGLGRIAAEVLSLARPKVVGLYLTGGDVAHAVLKELGGVGIDIKGEVLPLAAYGLLIGGPYEGLPLVTKGGLIGGEGAAVRCVGHLLEGDGARRSARPPREH